MKPNSNILIMIGLVALAPGKLQGSAEKESTEQTEENFHQMIKKFTGQFIEQMDDELAQSPDNYEKIDLSTIDTDLAAIREKTIPEEQDTLRSTLIKSALRTSEKKLADTLLINLTRLSEPITKQVDEITQYIEYSTFGPFPTFDLNNSSIKDSINNEINPRLDSIYQNGLFKDKVILAKADKLVKKDAIQATNNIINSGSELFFRFQQYIRKLNTTTEKDEKEFTKDHFDKTAQAILTMKWIIDNLYTKLVDIFSPIASLAPMISIFTMTVNDQEQIISKLKRKLYEIYGVKPVPFSNKISIKTYSWFLKGLAYSFPQDDPLKDIPPGFSQPSTALEAFGTLAVSMLATKMTDQIIEAVGEGMPLKQAVLMAIKGLGILGTTWVAKEGLAAAIATKKGLKEEEKALSTEEIKAREDIEVFRP